MADPRRTIAAALALVLLAGCVGGEPREPRPPKHKTWEEGPDANDFPERTTKDPYDPDTYLPRSPDPKRPNVKVELTVVDVISWDEIKIRGGVRGSVVRGVVSLTGWLGGAKDKGKSRRRTTQFVVVQAGREASIELSDPLLRDLVGPYAALRVAVIEATAKGEVDVAVAPLVSPTDDGQMTLATRVRVGSGEALVVGGHRSEREGEERGPGKFAEGSEKRDQLAILTATVLR